jgi:hypothetical protein
MSAHSNSIGGVFRGIALVLTILFCAVCGAYAQRAAKARHGRQVWTNI